MMIFPFDKYVRSLEQKRQEKVNYLEVGDKKTWLKQNERKLNRQGVTVWVTP